MSGVAATVGELGPVQKTCIEGGQDRGKEAGGNGEGRWSERRG